jgi:hypothetical protein
VSWCGGEEGVSVVTRDIVVRVLPCYFVILGVKIVAPERGGQKTRPDPVLLRLRCREIRGFRGYADIFKGLVKGC